MKKTHAPLERVLSKRGVLSRTEARKKILKGEVTVNGVLRRDPLLLVHIEKARITVQGQEAEAEPFQACLFYKPKGLITTRSDEKGRPTIFSVIKTERHLSAVGRLDQATSGLLILTNDTQFAAWLTDPTQGIPRVYLVSVRGAFAESGLEKLKIGVQDRGELLQVSEAELQKTSGRESHLKVTLREGKNREIRRLFKSLGHEVIRLKRISFGPLQLGELKVGEWRDLSLEELKACFADYFCTGSKTALSLG